MRRWRARSVSIIEPIARRRFTSVEGHRIARLREQRLAPRPVASVLLLYDRSITLPTLEQPPHAGDPPWRAIRALMFCSNRFASDPSPRRTGSIRYLTR